MDGPVSSHLLMSSIVILVFLSFSYQFTPPVDDIPDVVEGPAAVDLPSAHLVENLGQLGPERFGFGLDTSSGVVLFGASTVEVTFIAGDLAHTMKLEFPGSDLVEPVGEGSTGAYSNYLGHDQVFSRADHFQRVRYTDLWDGIDLVYSWNGQELKSDFYLDRASSLGDIRIGYEGVDALWLEGGELILGTPIGQLVESEPVSTQNEVIVEVEYVIDQAGILGYRGHDLDLDSPLVIDPLLWATYLGGGGDDVGQSVAVASNGDVLITGYTDSNNMPTTNGAYDRQLNGSRDAFVSRFDSSGSNLLWSTFIGGSADEAPFDIILDSVGRPIIIGRTASTDYPTTTGSYDEVHAGGDDAFITKLSADGTTLVWSTLYGGSGDEQAYSVAIDGSGDVFICGSTDSSDFPTSPGAYDSTPGGQVDGFVVGIRSDGVTRIWASLIGSTDADEAWDIEIDSQNRVVIAGYTLSALFPTTTGAHSEVLQGAWDGFASKFLADGSDLEWSTFVGGSSFDAGYAMVLDGNDNVLMTGETWSSDFGTVGSYAPNFAGGNNDAFIANLSSDGSSMNWVTYMGGNDLDNGYRLGLMSDGSIALAGFTTSTVFPITDLNYTDSNEGLDDIFVSVVSPDGSQLVFSTFLGGGGFERPQSMAIWMDHIIVIGASDSSDFPAINGYDSTWNTLNDAVLFSLSIYDGDGDGVVDGADAFPSDPTQHTDSDADGYGDSPTGTDPDGCPQLWGNSTSPLGCPDDDGDGISNSTDLWPNDASQSADADGDGWGDNISGTDPDACPGISGTSYLDELGCSDTDGDGLSDRLENITHGTAWNDADTDGSGVDDGTELFTDFTDPNDPLDDIVDSDGDGVPNGQDAFPLDPTQTSDFDGDTWGDDPAGNRPDDCPSEPGTSMHPHRQGCPDRDGDGIDDDNDAFPDDVDNDGLPDWWEEGNGTFVYQEDETQDPDGDGFSNLQEFEAGTDPQDPASHPDEGEDSDDTLFTIRGLKVSRFDVLSAGLSGSLILSGMLYLVYRRQKLPHYRRKIEHAEDLNELNEIWTEIEKKLHWGRILPNHGVILKEAVDKKRENMPRKTNPILPQVQEEAAPIEYTCPNCHNGIQWIDGYRWCESCQEYV